MIRSAIRVLTLVAVAGTLLAGCRATLPVTPVHTLLDDPARFDQHTVRILGDVTRSVSIMGYGAYEVTDPTGSLMVVTKADGAPRKGARVGVEGEFRSAFTLGEQTVAVIVESGRRLVPAGTK